MEPYDFRALRELLYSWGLLEVYEHFKDEGVNIEEMKIMNYHHVTELLQNYKLGTRIRFEYHYERWRRNLHKPLKTPYNTGHTSAAAPWYSNSNTHVMYDESSMKSQNQARRLKRPKSRTPSVDSNEGLEFEMKTTANPTPETSPTSKYVPASTTTSALTSTIPSPIYEPDVGKEMPKLTPQPKRFASTSTTDGGSEKPRAVTPPQSLGASPSPNITNLIGETLRMNCIGGDPIRALQFYDGIDKPALSVLRILQTSGRKGLEILDYYHAHNELKNSHRWLLINLIVNFFDDNNLHLSLNMSHHMEKQILEIFPTEKLQYYRTEKRGRIYVKFSNMKRYQRERSGVKRKWNKSLVPLMDKEVEIVDGNAEDDNGSLTLENWAPALPAGLDEEAEIKTEVISNDDYAYMNQYYHEQLQHHQQQQPSLQLQQQQQQQPSLQHQQPILHHEQQSQAQPQRKEESQI